MSDRLRLGVGSKSAFEVLEPLLHVRKLDTVRALSVAFPCFRVCVGDFVQLFTDDEVQHNFIMYVSEVYCDSVTDALSGFYVYRREDLSSLEGFDRYAVDPQEVLLSHHFVSVGLESVASVTTVVPMFWRSNESQFHYSKFFDHKTGKVYKIQFDLPKPECGLEFLWLNHESRCGMAGWGMVQRVVVAAMDSYCATWRERPGGPKRRGSVRLKLLHVELDDLLALPFTGVFENLKVDGGAATVEFTDAAGFEDVFGEGCLVKKLRARKAGGEEMIKYSFSLPMRLVVNGGEGGSHGTFAGV